MQSIIKAWQHLETDLLLYFSLAIPVRYSQEDVLCFKQTNIVNKFGQTPNKSKTSRATVLYLVLIYCKTVVALNTSSLFKLHCECVL